MERDSIQSRGNNGGAVNVLDYGVLVCLFSEKSEHKFCQPSSRRRKKRSERGFAFSARPSSNGPVAEWSQATMTARPAPSSSIQTTNKTPSFLPSMLPSSNDDACCRQPAAAAACRAGPRHRGRSQAHAATLSRSPLRAAARGHVYAPTRPLAYMTGGPRSRPGSLVAGSGRQPCT